MYVFLLLLTFSSSSPERLPPGRRLVALERDHAERGLSPPTEQMARDLYLYLWAAAPDLATVKDFVRFYAAMSKPRLSNKSTYESINTMEWFYTGFRRITGTEIGEEERSEVYHVSHNRESQTRSGLFPVGTPARLPLASTLGHM